MCGIAGILRFAGAAPGEAVAAALVERMAARLRHRGPDASGTWTEGPIALGHARLSIIDLAGGHQPMLSPCGRFAVSFNGEIFNHIELRDQLRTAGLEFRTRSDTEVILQAFAHWGDEFVNHLNGQWALALWDRNRQRLVLSRDRLGIRPLYYAVSDDHVSFASEIKALMADPTVPRQLDPVGLDQLFTLWAPLPPRTVFAGICELPPGCQVTISLDEHRPAGRNRPGWSERRYWQLDYGDEHAAERRYAGSIDACAAELRAVLDDAVRVRLRSDVPVGAYLSGGLDSSIITALTCRHADHLRTFSVTFDDAEHSGRAGSHYDESRHQRAMVEHLGTQHEALRCRAEDIAAAFPEVVRGAERPMLRTAPAPLWLLARLVRESDFKVVLTGEGADEMLAGYDIFKEAKVRRFCALMPDSAWRSRLFERLYPYLPNLSRQSPEYRQKFFGAAPDELDDRLFSHRPRWEMTAGIRRLLAPALRERLADHDPTADVAAMLPSGYADFSPLGQWQWLEAAILMPGYILSTQGDRMAMAHGVEGRFPFLDHRVAELAATIPPRWRMRGLTEKYLLRRAVADLLPEPIRRRTKQPYRAPDVNAFFDPDTGRARAEWIDAVTEPSRVAADGVFHPRAVAGLIAKARDGRATGTRDNMALCAVLSTQLLAAQFIHGDEFERSGTVPFFGQSTQLSRPTLTEKRDCPLPVHRGLPSAALETSPSLPTETVEL